MNRRHRRPQSMTIAFWNANGLPPKKYELEEFIQRQQLDAVLTGETHLPASNRLSFRNFRVYRTDREGAREGGTAILIKSTIDHHADHHLALDLNNIEITAITVNLATGPVKLVAAYKAPNRQLLENDLSEIFDTRGAVILAGDLNAKHPSWNSRVTNASGNCLRHFADDFHLLVHATAEPTVFPHNGQSDVLDIVVMKDVAQFHQLTVTALVRPQPRAAATWTGGTGRRGIPDASDGVVARFHGPTVNTPTANTGPITVIGDRTERASDSLNQQFYKSESLLQPRELNTWQFGLKTYLEHEGLWCCVEGRDPEESKDIKIQRDSKAKSKIILMVEPVNYIHIQTAKIAKEVWEKLRDTFHDSGLLRKVNLMRTLTTTKLENCSSIEDYVNKIITTAHKLNEIKFEITDEFLGTFLLAGLSDDYKPMIMAMESSGMRLTADSVETKLLEEVKSSNAGSVALFNRGKKNVQKFNPGCYNCNNFGHFAKNCTVKKKPNVHQPSSSGTKKGTSLFSTFGITNDPIDDANSWYVDSGASVHMTRNRNWLMIIRSPSQNSITVANNQQMKVDCVGDTKVKIGKDIVDIKNVLYVPNITTNLSSVRETVKNGNYVTFSSAQFSSTTIA
ncbi:hypothetical protein Trydic_g8321 [Trypoxylus dichotomus]